MGELIFSFGYGGSLIILGWVTHFFLIKMKRNQKEEQERNTIEKVGM
ncbi:hypothetical protein ACIQ4Z_12180 [Peribacillus asahii]